MWDSVGPTFNSALCPLYHHIKNPKYCNKTLGFGAVASLGNRKLGIDGGHALVECYAYTFVLCVALLFPFNINTFYIRRIQWITADLLPLLLCTATVYINAIHSCHQLLPRNIYMYTD